MDTAPLIYFIEGHQRYLDAVSYVFKRIDEGFLSAVTSSVTLAECLVVPCREQREELVACFSERIVGSEHTVFMVIDQDVAIKAAQLRGGQNLTLADAFQMAACMVSGCDAFLTNDPKLKRWKESRSSCWTRRSDRRRVQQPLRALAVGQLPRRHDLSSASRSSLQLAFPERTFSAFHNEPLGRSGGLPALLLEPAQDGLGGVAE